MIRVGITGGIASGKTLVCKVFECLGIPVYYADPVARQMMEARDDIRRELIHLLGKDIYNGTALNRPLFSSLIFSRKDLLQNVNSIIHPRVWEDFSTWAEQYPVKPYVMIETALLFESGGLHLVNKSITVISPPEIRIERAMRRPGMTRERILDIMRNQWTDEKRIPLSDYVLNNDENSLLLPHLLKIHRDLVNVA